jgi:hypothetical protein
VASEATPVQMCKEAGREGGGGMMPKWWRGCENRSARWGRLLISEKNLRCGLV